jgi:hypothetical protein
MRDCSGTIVTPEEAFHLTINSTLYLKHYGVHTYYDLRHHYILTLIGTWDDEKVQFDYSYDTASQIQAKRALVRMIPIQKEEIVMDPYQIESAIRLKFQEAVNLFSTHLMPKSPKPAQGAGRGIMRNKILDLLLEAYEMVKLLDNPRPFFGFGRNKEEFWRMLFWLEKIKHEVRHSNAGKISEKKKELRKLINRLEEIAVEYLSPPVYKEVTESDVEDYLATSPKYSKPMKVVVSRDGSGSSPDHYEVHSPFLKMNTDDQWAVKEFFPDYEEFLLDEDGKRMEDNLREVSVREVRLGKIIAKASVEMVPEMVIKKV